jgi:hypothetical protein
MKVLILIVAIANLIICGCQCQPYGSNTLPESSIKLTEQNSGSLTYIHIAPNRCPFIQSGHF